MTTPTPTAASAIASDHQPGMVPGMITVLGSINIDLVTRVRALPRPGETILADDYATLMGGKGANQAVAAARAAGGLIPVRMIGAVGDDGFGRLAVTNLLAEGIDVTDVRTVDAPTGCAFINVDDAGENVITVASGANRLLKAGGDLAGSEILILQMETPLSANLDMATAARKAGARVITNLAPVPAALDAAMLQRLLDVTDILVVNELEALAAAGALGLTTAEPAAAAQALARKTSRTIVATLGAKGALAVPASGEAFLTPAPAITPVDTTGAGDTFVGVLASALAEGLDLPAAVKRACKAASLACLTLGAQSAMPRRAAILETGEASEPKR
jgi:ribokinase